MPLFRRKASRQVTNEPYPDYDDTRWRYHLRTNAIETDHYCNEYVETINADRKEAARLFKNNDESRARSHAESALRNKRIVTALGALSPLSNALYQRSEPLAGYTSLVQVPEPARSGVVTIIFAAGHLDLKYLSETVSFLAAQFSLVHVEQIQHGEGELGELINPSVRDALSDGPPSRSEIDIEIASAVKEYFGVSVPPAPSPSSPTAQVATTPAQYAERSLLRNENETVRDSQTTPLSTNSSQMGRPLSPQLGQQLGPREMSRPLHDRNMKTPSPPRGQSSQANKMYSASSVPPRPVSTEVGADGHELAATVDIGSVQRRPKGPTQRAEPITNVSGTIFPGTAERIPVDEAVLDPGHSLPGHSLPVHERKQREEQDVPDYLRTFSDSDEMLLSRYEELRSVISV